MPDRVTKGQPCWRYAGWTMAKIGTTVVEEDPFTTAVLPSLPDNQW